MEEKIQIKIGCVDYLVNEIESLRQAKIISDAQISVMNNFFGLVNRIGDTPKVGYEEDRFYQAKREIREAKEALKNKESN